MTCPKCGVLAVEIATLRARIADLELRLKEEIEAEDLIREECERCRNRG